MYVKNDHTPKELGSFFDEIPDPHGKKLVIGSIYRHLCTDQSLFIDDFIKPLAKNSLYYLAGHYNFDLSNMNHDKSQ